MELDITQPVIVDNRGEQWFLRQGDNQICEAPSIDLAFDILEGLEHVIQERKAREAQLVPVGSLNPAEILAALYNNAKPVGLGKLVGGPEHMTVEMAQEFITENGGTRVDYVHGRPIKTELADEKLKPWLYDRDHGRGAMERVIKELTS